MGAGVCYDDKIVRVTNQVSRRQVRFSQSRIFALRLLVWEYGTLVFPLAGYPFIHDVQVSICQKRTNQSTLWRTFLADFTVVHDPRFQHCFDDLQYPLVLDSHVVQAF